jgi:hypothetical protein
MNIIHATHEAVQKFGGIGSVLEGLLSASAYQKAVRRSILVGPLSDPGDVTTLRREGEVIFSSFDAKGESRVSKALRNVEIEHNVNLVYGKRQFGDGIEAEVLLVDAAHVNPRKVLNFKHNLYQHFELSSERFFMPMK